MHACASVYFKTGHATFGIFRVNIGFSGKLVLINPMLASPHWRSWLTLLRKNCFLPSNYFCFAWNKAREVFFEKKTLKSPLEKIIPAPFKNPFKTWNQRNPLLRNLTENLFRIVPTFRRHSTPLIKKTKIPWIRKLEILLDYDWPPERVSATAIGYYGLQLMTSSVQV